MRLSLTHSLSASVTCCIVFVGCLALPITTAVAKKPPAAGLGKYKAHGNSHAHHKHHGGGHHQIYITPYGFGYGYHNDNFGIHIGPTYPAYTRPYYYPRTYDYYPRTYVDPSPHAIDAYPAETLPTSFLPTNASAAIYQASAEKAFREQRYEEALRQVNHAVLEDGDNGKLYLFVSQVQFAVGDYYGAADALRRAMSLLDPADWGYVVENFRSFYTNNDYVLQMDRLTKYIGQNPKAAHPRLIRGYHYQYLGHVDAARKELTTARQLNGDDETAVKLLTELSDK